MRRGPWNWACFVVAILWAWSRFGAEIIQHSERSKRNRGLVFSTTGGDSEPKLVQRFSIWPLTSWERRARSVRCSQTTPLPRGYRGDSAIALTGLLGTFEMDSWSSRTGSGWIARRGREFNARQSLSRGLPRVYPSSGCNGPIEHEVGGDCRPSTHGCTQRPTHGLNATFA